jgi:hypothetical protein
MITLHTPLLSRSQREQIKTLLNDVRLYDPVWSGVGFAIDESQDNDCCWLEDCNDEYAGVVLLNDISDILWRRI